MIDRKLLTVLVAFIAVVSAAAGPMARAADGPEGIDPPGEPDIGEAAPTSASTSRLRLLRFRIAEMTLLQNGGDSFSGVVSWNPFFELTDHFSLGAYAGASLAAGGDTMFPVLDFGAYGRYSVSRDIALELQAGAQTWMPDPGSATSFRMGLAGAYTLREPLLGVVDHFFVGYGAVLITDLATHDLRAGAGLSF